MKHVVAVMLISIRRWLMFRWWLFQSELSLMGWEVDRLLFHFQRHCIASLRGQQSYVDATRIEIFFHLIKRDCKMT